MKQKRLITICVFILATTAVAYSAPAKNPDSEYVGVGMVEQPGQVNSLDSRMKQDFELYRGLEEGHADQTSASTPKGDVNQDEYKPELESNQKSTEASLSENKRVKRQHYDHSHCYHDHCHDYYSDGHSHVRYHNYGYNNGYGYNNRGWRYNNGGWGYNRWNRRWWG